MQSPVPSAVWCLLEEKKFPLSLLGEYQVELACVPKSNRVVVKEASQVIFTSLSPLVINMNLFQIYLKASPFDIVERQMSSYMQNCSFPSISRPLLGQVSSFLRRSFSGGFFILYAISVVGRLLHLVLRLFQIYLNPSNRYSLDPARVSYYTFSVSFKNLTKTQWDIYYCYFHFIDKEIELLSNLPLNTRTAS